MGSTQYAYLVDYQGVALQANLKTRISGMIYVSV